MKEIQTELTYPCIECVTVSYDGTEISKALKAGEDVLLKAPKLKKKIIDLSKMVGSDIDMEFQYPDDANWHIAKLESIVSTSYFMEGNRHGSTFKCRIRQDHWHSWQGGECPLPEGLDVVISYDGRTGVTLLAMRPNIDWTSDIVAFKILGTAEGWRYEWGKDE